MLFSRHFASGSLPSPPSFFFLPRYLPLNAPCQPVAAAQDLRTGRTDSPIHAMVTCQA